MELILISNRPVHYKVAVTTLLTVVRAHCCGPLWGSLPTEGEQPGFICGSLACGFVAAGEVELKPDVMHSSPVRSMQSDDGAWVSTLTSSILMPFVVLQTQTISLSINKYNQKILPGIVRSSKKHCVDSIG